MFVTPLVRDEYHGVMGYGGSLGQKRRGGSWSSELHIFVEINKDQADTSTL